jgi:acyl-ACP thioesterase
MTPRPLKPAELVPYTGRGRRYRDEVRVGFSDATPSGRARLDAIARWLQDLALSDLLDAGVGQDGLWIVRRIRIRADRFPQLGETVRLEAFCSGLAGPCAERRTTIAGSRGARAEAVTLWAHLDHNTGKPHRLDTGFLTIFGPSAAGRRARVALRHPSPPLDALSEFWRFRAADLDPAGHVNNASYWQILEEELAQVEGLESLDAEIEYRSVARAGLATILRAGDLRWVIGASDEPSASIAILALSGGADEGRSWRPPVV